MLPYEPITCPKCGAQSWEETYQCWLCRQKLLSAPRVAAEPAALLPPKTVVTAQNLTPATTQAMVPETARRVFSFSLSTLMIYITAIAVGLGLGMLHPALGIIYGIFIMLPMIATTLYGVRRRFRGKVDTFWKRVGRFVLNVVIFVSVLVAIVVAIGIACFLICIVNPPNFQHPP